MCLLVLLLRQYSKMHGDLQTHKTITAKQTQLGHMFENTEKKICSDWRNYKDCTIKYTWYAKLQNSDHLRQGSNLRFREYPNFNTLYVNGLFCLGYPLHPSVSPHVFLVRNSKEATTISFHIIKLDTKGWIPIIWLLSNCFHKIIN